MFMLDDDMVLIYIIKSVLYMFCRYNNKCNLIINGYYRIGYTTSRKKA